MNYVISSSAPKSSSLQKAVKGSLDGQGPESPLFVNTPSPCTPEINSVDVSRKAAVVSNVLIVCIPYIKREVR